MSNKKDRDTKETMNLFADPKFARNAWRSVGQAIVNNPAKKPIQVFGKEGNPTLSSEIESYSYTKLRNDIKNLGKEDREPTELEMIMQCQIVKARFDTSAATFVRDTLGAKPVDESKIDAQVNNPYETMSDDELEMLLAFRAEKEKKNEKTDSTETT